MALMTFGAPIIAQNVETIRRDYNAAKHLEKRQQGDDASDINVFQTKVYKIGANGVIKLIVKRRPFGDESQFAQEYSGATVPDKYKAKLKELQSSSKYFKDLFDTLDNL